MFVKQAVVQKLAFAIGLTSRERYLHYSFTGRKIVLEALMPKEAI